VVSIMLARATMELSKKEDSEEAEEEQSMGAE
jgi:hypothetical protein